MLPICLSPRSGSGEAATVVPFCSAVDIPAANYWSIVVYDADTRGLLNNGEPFPSIASNQKFTANKDGSADVYFGPKAPKAKNANWIKTVPGRGYFLGVRLYSPTKAFFDQTWKPDNIEKVGDSK